MELLYAVSCARCQGTTWKGGRNRAGFQSGWQEEITDRRKDWKDKAQSLREDLDMGIAEIKKCPTCSTQFTREKDFKYHQKGCHECICEECNELFDHEQKLKRHKDKKHKDSYKCDHYQKTFAEKRNLIRHQKSHV